MHSETMITVRDVEASSRWYQRLLGCRSAHGGSEFDILEADGCVALLLHHDDPEEHPGMHDAAAGRLGNGVNFCYRTDDVDLAWQRACDLGAEVVAEPHANPQARHREFSVRDPDGYLVTVCSPYGT